jgi:hypothetical protein
VKKILADFERAIQASHGARSRFLWRERVVERFAGETVWAGEVLVFELLDHPSAARCYAWVVEGEITTVLGVPPVDSARAAVRTALVAADKEMAQR